MPDSETITINDAEPADVSNVQEVLYQTWLSTYPSEEFGITQEDIVEMFKDRFSSEKITKLKNDYENLSTEERIIIAKDDGRIVGVARLKKYPDKNQLKAMYVLPEYQGRGVGKMLWEETIRFFGLTKDIYVEVATYNTKAINFYSKLGFKDTGKRFSEERFKMKSGNLIPEMEMRINRK